jgi:hypothetical protein
MANHNRWRLGACHPTRGCYLLSPRRPKIARPFAQKCHQDGIHAAALVELRHRAVGCSKKNAKTEALVAAAIALPGGRVLMTLMDAGNYIAKLPKAEHTAKEWRAKISPS